MTRAPAKSFGDLLVWQKSHALALRVYKETSQFPKEEIYGLTSQMRRAAVSVPANIAEAFKRRRNPDKARVLNIAQGSLEELRYYMVLARDLAYTRQDVRWDEIEEIARMLGAYAQSLLASDDGTLNREP
jgi:four helix bundle protein